MAKYANQIKLAPNCGTDFDRQNPLVIQAYDGFIAYGTMYQAACLRSPTGSYCFADAITNFTSPTDSYVYYTGIGMPLPGGSRPTCNSCLEKTLDVFASASSNSSQPANRNYVNTAQLVNLGCGPDFVNSTIPAAASAGRLAAGSPRGLLTGLYLAVFLAIGHSLL
ncbi:MAG: hypothetical protein M1832_002240 [Thelocarpon impressellum]|nr:MAG: hypothetical protein M1832_002240 [Thelocarpon impressellum]